MYDSICHPDDFSWKESDFAGVTNKVLNTNPNTGGLTVLTRMDAGAEIPAHHHDIADELVYVLEGDFIENGQHYRPGTVFFAQAGTKHGPHHSQHGCVVLTQFSKTLDFVLD
ncbi:cupin domain-containing protein [Crateriforma conspicua]|uniref:ChrR Cupin-like domain protein n=1 Tax=Crateriforma conspicua TaxID=2527996 RepID=A0A5C6FRK3_9PLAN|nr:cupin domain-containing protein [Crateriforma conspicua]TWU63103.1 ChrR Cupin-like domain protein [Crateriforma conspicua]